MSGNLRLAFTLEAIDRATATVNKINSRIDKLTEPARKVSAAFSGMVKATRLDSIGLAADRVGARFSALTGQVTQLVAGIAGIGATAGAALFGFKGIADQVDLISDTAQMLGISSQDFQRLGFVADQNGSSIQEMGESLKFLSKNMSAAISGNQDMVSWFNRVGISVGQLSKGMSVIDVYKKIGDTFSHVGDTGKNSAKKIDVMMALLGRSGAGMRQVLDLGSASINDLMHEADRLGVVLSDDTVAAMGKFNDSWGRVRMTMFGVGATALGTVAPGLERLLTRITEWTAANRGLIATKFEAWINRISANLPAFIEGASQVATGIGRIFDAADRVADLLGGWPNLLAAIAGVMSLKLLISIADLVKAVGLLNVAMLTNPFGLALAAVSALVLALPLLVLHWDKVIGKVREFNDSIPTWLRNMSPAGWALNKIVTNLGAPTASPSGTALPVVGGALDIRISQDGSPRVAALSKTQGSPMNIDVGYVGAVMNLSR
jgi:hypothetical protein